jgi:signal transduction histidine kinase
VLRLSLRYQLGLTLIVVNVLLTAGVALVAYRAAHDAMVDQALRGVSTVAQSRERELLDLLQHRQARMGSFLRSLQSLCGETAPSGRFGWEDECVRAAVGGFHRSERALSTDVSYRGRRLTRFGPRQSIPTPLPSHLVRISATAGTGAYAMSANLNELTVHSEFALEDVNAIFADRAGLETSGEAYLTDDAGYRLTSSLRATARPYPVLMAAIGPCVRGDAQATQTTDDRGVAVIAGLRPATSLGGGCIVANVSYDDATAPIRRLGQLLVYASGLVGLIGGVVSVLIASFATRPLKRLAESTRELGEGRFDTRIPVEGPSEVRQLGQTLSRMAASISHLVRQEQQARREAEAANRTKDEFLATLSHELRTPLNAILGWASILSRSDYDKSRVSQAVHVIERNARIQSQMIEELLDVSRISAGTVQLNATAVPIASVVDAAVESIRPAADSKGVRLIKRITSPEVVLHADARRLQQVAWNLLSNAVRFTPPGGQVEVTLARDGDEVDLRVADTGCGIAPEFLPHVFERFRQADSSTTRAHGGLGLGLAIVRDLVELHGGSVRAESAGEGRGATFIVRLPTAPVQTETASRTPASVQPWRLQGARVLVVDDDADTRDVLKAVLEGAGAEVMITASAGETRAVFARTHPDLLIADIGMPDEDGYSLIASIRRMENGTSHVPAIALTARTRPEDVEQALSSGFQMHLSKPIDSGRLVDSIASLVLRTV